MALAFLSSQFPFENSTRFKASKSFGLNLHCIVILVHSKIPREHASKSVNSICSKTEKSAKGHREEWYPVSHLFLESLRFVWARLLNKT